MRLKSIALSVFVAAASLLSMAMPAQATMVEQCVYGSGSEASIQFCATNSLSQGRMISSTKPDRITCTVTVWEYWIPGAQYVTYAQAHYVGGVNLYTVIVNGDGNSSHYLQGNFYQRCDGSYAFTGWFSVGG